MRAISYESTDGTIQHCVNMVYVVSRRSKSDTRILVIDKLEIAWKYLELNKKQFLVIKWIIICYTGMIVYKLEKRCIDVNIIFEKTNKIIKRVWIQMPKIIKLRKNSLVGWSIKIYIYYSI